MVTRFCTRCGGPLPANATTCPRCNAPVTAPATPAASTATPSATGEVGASARRACSNCRAQMRWIGHYSLRASGTPGSGGPPGMEGSETLLPFSLYYCQTCGKFDFYYPGT